MHMKNLLGHNVFTTLEEIKSMLRKKRFTMDSLDARLAHVDGHFHSEFDNDEPLGSSVRALATISSLDSDDSFCLSILLVFLLCISTLLFWIAKEYSF